MFKVLTSSKKCGFCDTSKLTFVLNAPKRDFVNVVCSKHLHDKLGEWEKEDAAEKELKNSAKAAEARTA